MITKVYYSGETGNFIDSTTQGLFLAKFDAPYPDVKKTTVDIAGVDGLIDLSEALTGKPVYNNRTITMKFFLLEGATFDVEDFVNTYHGRIMRFYTDENTNYYYMGRATVTKDDRMRKLRSITITVDASPMVWNRVETQQSFAVKTGSTSVFTQVSTANMASGFPSVATKNITIKFQQTTPPSSQGSATYSFAVSDTKLYVLACTISASVALSNTGYSITTGNGTVYGTQLIKPKSGDTTATVKFYTGTSGYNVAFNNICLIELQEVERETAISGTSSPYFLCSRDCHVYVLADKNIAKPIDYTLMANVPCYTPDVDVTKQDAGGQTGIYVGAGLSSANDTARLWYRKGVLA